jgi:hypothetical protein
MDNKIPVFRFIIYCKDRDIFRHHEQCHGFSRAHVRLEKMIEDGVTLHTKRTGTWTRISPNHIKFIEMVEVKDNG